MDLEIEYSQHIDCYGNIENEISFKCGRACIYNIGNTKEEALLEFVQNLKEMYKWYKEKYLIDFKGTGKWKETHLRLKKIFDTINIEDYEYGKIQSKLKIGRTVKCGYKPDGSINCLEYNANGDLEKLFSYKNGKLQGLYCEYNDHGRIYLECNYDNGKLHGEVREYDKIGEITGRYYYQYGKAIKINT